MQLKRICELLLSIVTLQSFSQCPNDVCENATEIDFNDGVVCISQCNFDCTDEGQFTDCIGQDVDFWYSLSLPYPSMIIIEATGTYEHPSLSVGDGFQIVIMDGCGGEVFYCENVISPQPQYFFDATEMLPDGEYLIQIDGLNPSMGCVDMCFVEVGLLGLDVEELESIRNEGYDFASSIKIAYLRGRLNRQK